ncbi:MAG: hypothetical protein M3Z33_03285 [Actinomycetota bacterium]|nr:hypothetical protein [Actinomycetota bacterium]
MTILPIALAGAERDLWYVALGLGLVVVLVVAALMLVLLNFVKNIQASVGGLLEVAGKVAANTEYIPQLEATTPVLEQIADEVVVQDAYMNALTQGYAKAPE